MGAIANIIIMALSVATVASAQAPANCAVGVMVCGTNCCSGPPAAFNCSPAGACIPMEPVPSVSISVTSITLITTSPAGSHTTKAPDTTVSVPLVTGSVTTIVSSVNVTSWSTTAFTTANSTGATHSHSATGTESSETPKPSGAAGVLRAGTGVLGVVVAVVLGAL